MDLLIAGKPADVPRLPYRKTDYGLFFTIVFIRKNLK